MLTLCIVVTGCGAVKDKARHAAEKVVKSGADIIQSAGKGLSEGFTDIDITLISDLNDLSVEIGPSRKIIGEDVVSIYFISHEPFENTFRLYAFNDSGEEIGRSTVSVTLDRDTADYVDFIFDNRTPLTQAQRYELHLIR